MNSTLLEAWRGTVKIKGVQWHVVGQEVGKLAQIIIDLVFNGCGYRAGDWHRLFMTVNTKYIYIKG